MDEKPGPREKAQHKVLHGLVFITWLPPALLAVVLAFARPEAISWRFALTLVGLAFLSLLAARSSRSPLPELLLAASTFMLLLVVPELVLRATGFHFDSRSVVQFGRPTPDELIYLEPDPELFWKLPASRPDVNKLGFFGPEVLIPKPRNTWRMVFFGDSCTQQGFPAGVPPKLRTLVPDGPLFEAVNLGVAGYTSHQGRVVADRLAAKLQPDVGVVFYGWNDHWQAYGATDREKARRGYVPADWLRWLEAHARLMQVFVKLRADRSRTPLATPRVPLPEYRANLEAIGQRIQDAGGLVLMLTAPSSHAALGVPDHLVKEGYAASEAAVLQWHADYNQVVREACDSHGWMLLDLAARADTLSRPGDFFSEDGIHFTTQGLDWLAGEIAQALATRLSPE